MVRLGNRSGVRARLGWTTRSKRYFWLMAVGADTIGSSCAVDIATIVRLAGAARDQPVAGASFETARITRLAGEKYK